MIPNQELEGIDNNFQVPIWVQKCEYVLNCKLSILFNSTEQIMENSEIVFVLQ